MRMRTRLGAGVAMLALVGGQAWADVTPEQVWQSWLDYYKASGVTLTEGSRNQQGDTLVITDAVMTSPKVEEETGTATITIPQISLRDMGDGKVEMTMADTMPFVFTGKSAEDKPTEAKGKAVMTGAKMIVSGTPEAMSYDVAMPVMTVTLDEISEDGTKVPMNVTVGVNDTTGTYQVDQTSGHQVVAALKSKSMNLSIVGNDPEDGSSIDFKWNMADLAMDSTTIIPSGVTMDDLGAALKGGMEVKGTMTFGPGQIEATIVDKSEEAGGSGKITGTDNGGSGSFAMSKAGLTYDAQSNGGKANMTFDQLPFPVDYAYDKAAMAMNMPVSAADVPSPFGFRMELGGLSVSENLWAMFDPSQQLPRDPVNLLIDLAGTAKVTADLFDPATMAADNSEMPFNFETLDIKSVAISAVGASVTANGAMKFLPAPAQPEGMDGMTGMDGMDGMSGMEGMSGMDGMAGDSIKNQSAEGEPTEEATDMAQAGVLPVGTIEAKATGINTLLDKLTAMGLIPEDQVSGFRMMLALFAKADGEDSLTSKIEFREDGGVYANDQRIQ